MPWNNSGMASGAASGASAGAAFGPWGAAIGGVAGGVLGGLSGEQTTPEMPTLPATRYPGAVSSPYGSLIYDPVTGGTRYITNQAQGGYTPTSYQDAALYDALMGGTGATSSLSNQIQQQQLMLDQLKAQGGGKVPTYEDYGIPIDPKTGQPINYQNYINKRGADNPLWETFMKDTGGKYGSDNVDISFGKWAKDWTNKSLNPAIDSYKIAQKVYGTNQDAANQAIQQQELQLQQMKSLAGDKSAAGAGVAENPLLTALRQQEMEANSPAYLRAMNAQTQEAYDNQLRSQDQALAARGLGGSGLAEMTRARMGLQLGNAMNQNALAANQMAGDKRQAALANRMNMLNFLSGRKDTAFNQGMAQQGLGLQMTGMGSNYGMQNLGNAMQRDIAQAGIQGQFNLANANTQNANRMAESRNWASALGGLGYGLGSGSFNWGSPSTHTGTSYGGDTINPIDTGSRAYTDYSDMFIKPGTTGGR